MRLDEDSVVQGVSVVVPTYNRAAQLRRCLQSLESQSLEQDAYEVIVVDDGSTDDTEDVLVSFQARGQMNLPYVEWGHLGPASARNEGAKHASEPILGFIDDDCIADENWLRNLRDSFRPRGTGVVEGKVIARGPVNPLMHVVTNMEGGQYLTANIAYRRVVFKQMGGFDETFPHAMGEDYDLAWRTMQAGYNVAFSPDAIVWHPTSYESLSDSLRRIRMWASIIYLAQRHPRRFRSKNGWGLRSHLVVYALGIPVIEFLHYHRFLLSSPHRLSNWSVRRLANSAYCLYMLLRRGARTAGS